MDVAEIGKKHQPYVVVQHKVKRRRGASFAERFELYPWLDVRTEPDFHRCVASTNCDVSMAAAIRLLFPE